MAKLMTLHPISLNQFGLIASDSGDDDRRARPCLEPGSKKKPLTVALDALHIDDFVDGMDIKKVLLVVWATMSTQWLRGWK